MKYLIMGCNGMAGHVISLYLKEQGHDVHGFARKQSDLVDTIVGDAEDEKLVRKTIEEGEYDYVVNCIGVLNQYAETEKARAVYLNAYFPHFLADIVKESKTKIIHLSTDCVFSGKKGQYEEDDLRDGETFYARSKALGELEDNKNITIRTSIVGPDRNEDGIGLLNWFMKQEGVIKGYTRAIWTGVTTLELAKAIEQMSNGEFAGLYNVVPKESISKYELLRVFNKILRNGELNIIPDDSIVVDKSLIRSEIVEKKLGILYYEKMVMELKKWIEDKESLYLGRYKAR
jgi:dTDP-4-dehydrorhamnose reductase